MLLEPKRYTNTVLCSLPHNLPSSFNGANGQIRYFVRVLVDAGGHIDEIQESEFKVYTPLDLNSLPHLMQPKALEMSRSFSCWIWRNGPLNISAFIPYTGFVPNSQIPITIECENGSSVDLNSVKVYIKQIVTFHCTDPKRETRIDESQLCETKLDGVSKHTTKTVRGILLIPDIKSTNLTSCGIIEIKHVLKMKGVTNGANANLFNEVPVILGTVPLVNVNLHEAPIATIADNATSVDAPPPNYDDVVNTKVA